MPDDPSLPVANVAIIGGGIVGLSTGHELQSRGRSVLRRGSILPC